jgi:flagellar biosynthetic protein FliR
MDLSLFGLSGTTLLAFLLVLARTSAWVISAPVLSAKGVSPVGRLALVLTLSLFLTPLVPIGGIPADLPGFTALVLVQVLVGLAFGFLTQLLYSAVEIAGSLMDLTSGLSYSAVVDPLSGQPAAAFSRLTSVAFGAVFLVTDAYTTVITGFARSFTALPLEHVPTLADGFGTNIASAVTQTLAAALEIAAPLLGVLFLTDVALGLAARFVPQANALQLSLPVKTLVALTAAGATLALLPGHIAGLTDPAVRLPFEVLR